MMTCANGQIVIPAAWYLVPLRASAIAYWVLWREGASQATKRLVGATALVFVLVGVPIAADTVINRNCDEDHWRQICGGAWCWCAWLSYGCDCDNPNIPGLTT
jgi:hypothetical protein